MNNVAILMPTYQGIKYINQQIQTIINQKYVNLTLFISVDPSSDGTIDFLRRLSKSINKIKIIKHYKNFGSPTKNFFNLISKVNTKKYDYIGLADHDDLWEKNKVITGINMLNDKKVDCYSSSIIAFRGDKKKFIDKSFAQTKYDHYFESAGPGSTFLFRPNFIEKFQKFLIKNKDAWNFKHYDWLIYSFARENRFKWFIDKRPMLQYRQHENNYTGANWGYKAAFSRFSSVINGQAFDESLRLSKIIKYKNNFFTNKYFFITNLLLRSNQFRRKFSEKILLNLYFIFIFVFGKFENEKLKFNILKFFRILILISSLYSIYYLLNEINLGLFKFNLEVIPFFFIINLFLLFIISKRFFIFFSKMSMKTIGFGNWFNIFVESQVMSFLIPYSNIIYRGYRLEKIINLDIGNSIFLTSFILFIENYYTFSLLLAVMFLYTGSKIIFLSSFLVFVLSIIFFNIRFNLILSFLLNLYSKYIELFKKKLPFSIKKKELPTIRTFNLIEVIYFNLMVILKIFLNYLIYYSISYFMNLEINPLEIFLILFINQLFDVVKITPQNIGISEIVNGVLFYQLLGLPIQQGIIFKILHRIIEVFSQLVSLICIKSFLYIFSFSKKNNINLSDV